MPTRDYNSIVISRELLTKIFSHITVQDTGYKTPCWLWNPEKPWRYGQIRLDGINYPPYRLIYHLLVEPVCPSLECDHLCRVPSCVNPVHIEAVTPTTNKLRGVSPPAQNARKTHCIYGHEFIEENIYWVNGQRNCKACYKRRGEELRRRRGMIKKSETHCIHGHEYTPENTYVSPQGNRYCIQCRKKNVRNHTARKKLNE